jgi:hypothetical protein
MDWKQVEGDWEQVMGVVHLAEQVESIRVDILSLISTVEAISNKQQVEDAIRQNPLSAVVIAACLGFLVGTFT